MCSAGTNCWPSWGWTSSPRGDHREPIPLLQGNKSAPVFLKRRSAKPNQTAAALQESGSTDSLGGFQSIESDAIVSHRQVHTRHAGHVATRGLPPIPHLEECTHRLVHEAGNKLRHVYTRVRGTTIGLQYRRPPRLAFSRKQLAQRQRWNTGRSTPVFSPPCW